MRVIRPKALRRGDVIGICAPASPPTSRNELARGISYLEKLGYRVELGANVYRRRGYLAGSDQERASDLNRLFADRRVKAIFTVRGGYGTHRILPLLDFTAISRNPKILVGYSDITALSLALLTRFHLVTFSGPMVASEMAPGLTGEAEEVFWRCLTSTRPPKPIPCSARREPAIRRGRVSVGRLAGGNLSMASSLVGTQHFPDMSGFIVFLEEIDERPYRIDRMLRQLRDTRLVANAAGIVFGRFIGCTAEPGKPSLTLKQVISDTFRDYRFPLLAGLPYGHTKGSLTVPYGVKARLNASARRLEFLEAGVS